MSVTAEDDVENPGVSSPSEEAKTEDDIKATNVTENNDDTENNVSDDNAADLLCGMKRRTAYVVIAIISAVLIVGITLGVIYGRPASWKLAVDYTEGTKVGSAMMISGDGSTLALIEESPWINDIIGVQVIPTLSSDEERKATVPLSPFLQVDEEYPLPANSAFGDDFIPLGTDYDLSLSGDGNMIAILGSAPFIEQYRYEDNKGFRFHCNTTVVDPPDRLYGECRYSRATVFKREDSNSEWKSFGQPIEHMTTSKGSDRRQVVSLSKNGKRLAIGYNGGVDIYQQDEDDEWVQVGNSILVEEICGNYDSSVPVCGFGSSISLDNDGGSIAVSGFKSSKTAVYKLMGDSWEVMGEELPVSSPLTVSLSDGGNRVAVASQVGPPLNYDGPPAEIQVFEYNADNDSWLQLPSIDGFEECCNDNTAGSGVSISGDGNTIVYSTLAQPYRFGGNEWIPVGQALERGSGVPRTSVTGDGERVVVGVASFRSGNSWVKVYDLRRGL